MADVQCVYVCAFACTQLDPDFWAAALTCKEGDWLREPVKTQWGWHLIMVQHRLTKSAKGGKNAATGKKK